MQETALTAQWRDAQVEIKPNGMPEAERKREIEEGRGAGRSRPDVRA